MGLIPFHRAMVWQVRWRYHPDRPRDRTAIRIHPLGVLMNPIHELIGYLAATLTTVSFVPQVLRTLRIRDTRAISLGMYLLFSAGVALWLIYGMLIGAWPIILANTATLGLTLTVLWYKHREGRAGSIPDATGGSKGGGEEAARVPIRGRKGLVTPRAPS